MSIANIASLCRVCVNPSYYHVNIFNKLSLDGDRLSEAINTLCQLDIVEGDGLPEHICKECNSKVSEFEVFKQNSQIGRRELLALKKEELGECIENEGVISRFFGSDEIEIEEHHPDFKTERVDEENEGDCSEDHGGNDNRYSSTNNPDIEPPNKAIAQTNVKLEENLLMTGCQNEEESLVDVSLNHQHEFFIKVESQDYEQFIDESTSYHETSDNVQNYSEYVRHHSARRIRRNKKLCLSDKRKKNRGGQRLLLWKLAQKELANNLNTPVSAPDGISVPQGSPNTYNNSLSGHMNEQPEICLRKGILKDPLATEETSDEEVTTTKGFQNKLSLLDREKDMKNMTPGVTCVDKLEFEEKLSKYLEHKPQTKIWSKSYIQKIITILNETKVDEENGKELSTNQIHYRMLYDTKETPSGIRLVYKHRWCKFFVPYEEYYDILFQCHAKTFHSNANTFPDELIKGIIPNEVVVLFANSCGFNRDRIQRLCNGLSLRVGDPTKGKYKPGKPSNIQMNGKWSTGPVSKDSKKDADPEWLPKYF